MTGMEGRKALYKVLSHQAMHINLLQKMVKSLADVIAIKMQVTSSEAYNQNIVQPLRRNRTTSLIGEKAVNRTAYNAGLNAAQNPKDNQGMDFPEGISSRMRNAGRAIDTSLGVTLNNFQDHDDWVDTYDEIHRNIET